MTKHDRAALTLALEQARTESPERAQQIDSMLEDRPWFEVATFAASCAQSRALDLMPWEHAPVLVSDDDDDPIIADAVRLLRRMLAAGVSGYHPDPMTALEQAKRKGAA